MVELRQSSSPARVRIRCAVYTRKSSEEGLEQEFNSLDAQREACEAYITSQKHEGWTVLEAGLVREIKAKTGMEAWRRDEETGQAYSLKLTDAGLKAIAADERGSQSIPSSVRPENPIPSAFCTAFCCCASSSLLATSVYFSPSSRRPSVTVLVTSLPSRTTTTSTDLPTSIEATRRGRSRDFLMSLPSNLTITSPGISPAGLADPCRRRRR